MNLTLRKYQFDLKNRVRESFRSGCQAVLLQLPTGGGKTAIFSSIAEGTMARGNRVNIIVHRDCILQQAIKLLTDMGLPFGVIAPGHSMTGDLIQLSSVYTLARRLGRVPAPELIIIDEAHHARAGTWEAILGAWTAGPTARSRVLGVTATPCRLDGNGLGKQAGGFFDNLICGPDVSELTAAGYLSPAVVYMPPSGLDLSGLHKRYGDFVESEIADRVDKPKITGSAIDHYRRYCEGAPAVAFCANVMHAEHVAAEFTSAGYPAASIDGKLPRGVIDRRLADLNTGALKVITSCMLISEGFDLPNCVCAIGLRPTLSLSLHLQQWGRVLRPAPGKQAAVILDHVGNVYRHGLPTDPRNWTLAGTPKKAAEEDQGPKLRQCEKCYAIFPRALDRCPQCGAPVIMSAHEIKQVEGELVKFEAEKRAAVEKREKRIEMGVLIRGYHDGYVDAAELQSGLKEIARQRGYKPGWAWVRYVQIAGITHEQEAVI